MPSEMLADDEDVAEELLDEELGDEDDEEGIIGTSIVLDFYHIYFFAIFYFHTCCPCMSQLELGSHFIMFQYRSAPSYPHVTFVCSFYG